MWPAYSAITCAKVRNGKDGFKRMPNDHRNLMRLKVLALSTLALAACQSAPEAPPPAVAPVAPIAAAGSASLDLIGDDHPA